MSSGPSRVLGVLVTILFFGAAGSARADSNLGTIAVPLLGTQGAAGPYPSSIALNARGGPSQTGVVRVVLLGVTHPCPEDLAILLVRNNTDKYLLMSNAGGCRPLLATRVTFNSAGMVLPDTQPVTPPFGATLTIDASNYGAPPVFPAPAPTGPYVMGMPPASGLISGTWQLYVFDTTATNRGVITGWSLEYDTNIVSTAQQTLVAVPATGTGPGPAGTYPITFDLSAVPADVPVFRVILEITLRHTFPDDLRLVFQSPAGTAVALMANAGGDVDIAPGSVLTFADGGALLTDAGAIVTGVYSPGQIFGAGSTIPAPGPATPHEATFASFIGQLARGTWNLWVFDDASADAGQLTSAKLTIETEVFPNPILVTPTAAVTTSDQPFVHFEIDVPTGPASTLVVQYRVTNDTQVIEGGVLHNIVGTTLFAADVPLKKGTNTVTYSARNTKSQSLTTSKPLAVSEFTYSLAEGATGTFFDTEVTLANPTGEDAPVTLDLLPEGGGTLTLLTTVPANAPLQIVADTLVLDNAISTVVRSTNAVPLAVERTMIWDSTGYGGHGGTAVGPSTRWLFAEGSQGFFDTYVLLANDNPTPTDVTVKFLLEGGGVVTLPVNVLAKSRKTIYAGDLAALDNRSFGIDITSPLPIIAERAMYLPGARLFEGGHESAGVNATSTRWFLAEGATGSFFDTYVLLSNPNSTTANVNISYLLPNGTTVPQAVSMPANSRLTINVETVNAQLADTAVSTSVVSDIGIVAERAMYWPDFATFGWREAHNSFGVTQTALRWGLADGRIGTGRNYQTFILLANPNAFTAEVQVRFLMPGVTVTQTYTLAPFSRFNIWANEDVPGLTGAFSADVQVLNFQPIAVEKAVYWDAGGETFAAGTNVSGTRLPPP